MLFHEGQKVRKEQRLLLEVYGLLLSRLQGNAGQRNRLARQGVQGHEGTAGRGLRKAERLLRELQYLRVAVPPRLLLNDHCQVCEFRKRCHEQAVQEDNLSLLRGIGEKEVKGHARKGILTLTQLAHMFRPRRRGKRAVRKTHHRYHALQALAIRDKRILRIRHAGTPRRPSAGLPRHRGRARRGLRLPDRDGRRRGRHEKQFSFWADTKEQETDIFEQFMAEVSGYEDFRVFVMAAMSGPS